MAHWQENLVSPPASEPVTLAEAKSHARITIADDDDDVTKLIVAARKPCETYLKALFVYQTWQYVGDGFPGGGGYFNRNIRALGPTVGAWLPTNNFPIQLPRTPLVSVSSITYIDSNGTLQTLDPALYLVEPGTPGRIAPTYGQIWPTVRNQIGAIKITYVAGKAPTGDAVPENIKLAIKILVAGYYQDRESIGSVPEGVYRLLDDDDPGYYG